MDSVNENFDMDKNLHDKYKNNVANELKTICQEILGLLNNCIFKTVKGLRNETEILYLKLFGDFYRYLAEVEQTDECKNKSRYYYEQAMDILTQDFDELHPSRFAFVLDISLIYKQVFEKTDKVVDFVTKSFNPAIQKLDSLKNPAYPYLPDATLTGQMLRQRILVWMHRM